MKDDLINALFNLPDNDGKTPLDLLIVNLKHASRGDEYGLSEIEQRQLRFKKIYPWKNWDWPPTVDEMNAFNSKYEKKT